MLRLILRFRLGRQRYRHLKDLWFFLACADGIAEARIRGERLHSFTEALRPLVGK